MTTDDVLRALADPTRRAILERLSEGPSSVVALAGRVPVTRSAVSQHLRVLKDAGLVVDDAEGTRRIYRLEPAGLDDLRHYLDRFWADALARLKARAEHPQEGSNR